MVAEHDICCTARLYSCSLAKISMVAELKLVEKKQNLSCSLAKISMVAEHSYI